MDNYKTPEDIPDQETREQQKDELEVSHKFIYSITLACGLSSMQLGFALTASGGVYPDLVYLFNFEQKDVDSMLAMLSVCCIGGLALGAAIGGKIIENNRRAPIIIFNWIAMIGCMISIIENFTIICIGRFIFGFSTGVLIIAAPKILEETVPDYYLERGYGASTNLFQMTGLMINMLLCSKIPQNGLDVKTRDVDNFWKFVYLLPMVSCFLSFMMFVFEHQYESITLHVKLGQQQKALRILEKLYSGPFDEQRLKKYNELKQKYNVQDKEKFTVQDTSLQSEEGQNYEVPLREQPAERKLPGVSYIEALTDPKYRESTFLCILLAMANQLSGMNAIAIYSKVILSNINSNEIHKPVDWDVTPNEGCAYLGISSFLGAVISIYVIQKTEKRKNIFVIGHFLIFLTLLISGSFYAYGQGYGSLIFMCISVCIFQATTGGSFWLYLSMEATDKAMGLSLFTLMGLLLLQAKYTQDVLQSIGVHGLFYLFSAIQLITAVTLHKFMDQEKGQVEDQSEMTPLNSENYDKTQ